MSTLDKINIAEALLHSYPELNLELANNIVDTMFEQISIALMCGDRVELRGFCSMIIRKRKDRIIRNPKTQKYVKVDPRGVIYFRASRELINALNMDNMSNKPALTLSNKE